MAYVVKVGYLCVNCGKEESYEEWLHFESPDPSTRHGLGACKREDQVIDFLDLRETRDYR